MKTVTTEKLRPARPRKRQPHGRLSGEKLGKLAARMVASDDPVETAELQEAMVRGFYGDKSHA
ncbi:MAG: hypothetical protein ABSC18_00700 [Verrucomicrobiota bacterium]|jgi:hypothetical protein